MVQGDVLLQAHRFAHNNQEGLNHGKAREDRTCNEIRGENRGMPAWNDGSRKVEGYNGVNRKNQRRRKTGQNQRHTLKTLPSLSRTIPAKTHQSVDFATNAHSPVADRGQIRNQSNIPENQGNGEIG